MRAHFSIVYTAAILLILLSANLSYAQKDLRVGTTMMVSDNIYRNYTQKGDMVFLPYAGLGYSLSPADNDKLFFGYEGGLFLFRKLSHRDFSVHQLGADYNHLWPESGKLLALGGKLETRFNPEDYRYYNYTSGGFYLNYKTYFKENIMFRAGYNLNGKNFNEFPEFNYAENILALQTSISFQTRTTLRLSVNYYHKNYTSGVRSLDSLFIPMGRVPAWEQGAGGFGRMLRGNFVESEGGFYRYIMREDEFASTDQLKLGITVAQNLAQGIGLMLGYSARMNPRNHNRYLPGLEESVVNNEELFDDHYSYLGHEGSVQLKQMLPAESMLTLLFTAKSRKFSGRPAMDLEGYYLPTGESRVDRAFMFEAGFTKRIGLGSFLVLNEVDLNAQLVMGKNSSNDEYYDYRNTYFLVSMEKAF